MISGVILVYSQALSHAGIKITKWKKNQKKNARIFILKDSSIIRICPKSLQKVEPMSEELVYYKDLSEEPLKIWACIWHSPLSQKEVQEGCAEELVYWKDLSEEPSKMCICPKRTQSRRRDLSEEPLKIQDLHVNRRIFPAPSVMHAQDFCLF